MAAKMFLKMSAIGMLVALTAASNSEFYSSMANTNENKNDVGGTKCVGGPCGPEHQKCIGNPPKYTFHLSDPTCGINDPNGPFYDPVHGMYHNFYQIHLAEPMDGSGNGPDWGHWVSKDFIKWAQLPVAIWNDHYYDNAAIYTGSTTIVDGKPVIVYPGKCDGKLGCNDGKGGFTYVIVVPEDASDPLYTNWSKTGQVNGKTFSNPILNSTGDDPSTAWQTKDGEWRMIGNQRCNPEGGKNTPLYGSMDFVSWYKIGCTTLQAGDCPTFFPLPSLTPGSEHYVATHDGPMPDHVHKSGGSHGDSLQVGQWVDGKPGPAGTGTVGTWTITPGSLNVLLDTGKTHASKDFFDPIKKRRIMWVWGTVPSGIQTIPRDMTYHPGLKQIVYAPVEEMITLREKTVASLPATPLQPATAVALAVTGACDIELFFAVPTAATNFTVTIDTQPVTIAFVPGMGTPYKVSVGAHPFADTLPMLADDTSLALRIFLDGTVGEAYWQNGRVAMTFPIPTGATSVNITASAAAHLLNATSYSMGDIHTSTAAVLATERLI